MEPILVDFSRSEGIIAPLHGVNNGPLSNHGYMDTSAEYRAAGIPLVRLHDTCYPRPNLVDIPQVFPDFSADPEDPASYDFALTDDIISGIIACGARPLYRLGTSIEHDRIKKHIFPPESPEKWAAICIGIIRHYTEGWADGFRYDMPYWEIWNEPDLTENMWLGTPEQYQELYCTAAARIKARFPHLKVGGCAACSVWDRDFVSGFLRSVRDTGAPLDFFSWHWYGDDPESLRETAAEARRLMEEYGLGSAESICDEWNYMRGTMWVPARRDKYFRRDTYERQKNHFGASFTAACMTVMQQSGLAAAAYYDGQPSSSFCGIFDRYGIETKTYRVFQAFDALYRLGERTKAVSQTPGVYALAARGEGEAALLVSNFAAPGETCPIRLAGLGKGTAEIFRISEFEDLLPTKTVALEGGEQELTEILMRNSVLLIRIRES